jgi:hypothetical protein
MDRVGGQACRVPPCRIRSIQEAIDFDMPKRASIARLVGRIAREWLPSQSRPQHQPVLRVTSDLLRRVGAALYGQHWHSELAHTLGVNRRIVQRWAAGDSPTPPTLSRNLARLVAVRREELGKLYRKITSH